MLEATLARARALKKHVKWLGVPLDEFCVTVNKEEGFELLAWFSVNEIPENFNRELLARDIAKALKKGDPFPVLEHFRLFGFEIVPEKSTH